MADFTTTEAQQNGLPNGKDKKKIQDRNWKDPLRELHPSTAVVHAGYRSRMSERALKAPVFRSSTFEFPTAADGALFFSRAYHLPGNDGQEPGLIYSRLNNPSIEIFEDKMVAAERGATHGVAFPSGMSAITTATLALVPSGGRVLFTDPVYGGTYFLFQRLCPQRFGVEAVSVDTMDLGAVEDAMRTRGPFAMIFLETPANPTMTLTDIAAIVALRDRHCPKAVVAVDNTFLGPVFQCPFEHGADIVVYSATKFIGGHSDCLGGVVLVKSAAHAAAVTGMRTITGPVMAPDTAWMLTRSLETLWLRMERQASKAAKVCAALRGHPRIAAVVYPGLVAAEGSPAERELCERQLTGFGSMFTLTVRPTTRKAAFSVLDALKVCHLAVSLRGTETLVQHPRSMTHSDLEGADLDRCGITEGMLRVSIGLESSKDIVADFVTALDAIQEEEYKE